MDFFNVELIHMAIGMLAFKKLLNSILTLALSCLFIDGMDSYLFGIVGRSSFSRSELLIGSSFFHSIVGLFSLTFSTFSLFLLAPLFSPLFHFH